MQMIISKLGAPVVATLVFASAAMAGQKDKVQVFYDLLSNPGSLSHQEAFKDVADDNWVSIGDFTGKNKTKEAFLGQMGFFASLIPDLNWEVLAMHQDDDVITVRSRATGTPTAPLFDVDGEGRGFEILTIDIHELDDGKIVRTYHVEDWAGALQQLSGK